MVGPVARIKNACVNVIDASGKIVTKTEGAEKFAKLVSSVIDFIERFKLWPAHLASCIILRGRLKGFVDLVCGLNFFSRWKEVFCRDDKGKYFYADAANSLQKKLSRGFLVVTHTVEFFLLLDATQLLPLGRIASQTIGNLPILRTIKDLTVTISAIFGIWDNSLKWSKANKEMEGVRSKIDKWAGIAASLKPADKAHVQFQEGVINKLVQGYEKKVDAISGDLAKLENTDPKYKLQYKLLEDKRNKYKGYIDGMKAAGQPSAAEKLNSLVELKKISFSSKADKGLIEARAKVLACESVLAGLEAAKPQASGDALKELEPKIAAAKAQFDSAKATLDSKEKSVSNMNALDSKEMSAYKLDVLGVKKGNIQSNQTKAWVSVAYDLGKIALVTLATLGTALALFGSMHFAVPFILLCITVNAIGFGKFLHEEWWGKPRAVPVIATWDSRKVAAAAA